MLTGVNGTFSFNCSGLGEIFAHWIMDLYSANIAWAFMIVNFRRRDR